MSVRSSWFIVVQLLSHVQLFAIPWIEACQASLSFTISLSLLILMFIESVMPSTCLIVCYPLLLLPSIFPSIRVFSVSESALCIRWLKYWSFCFSNSPSSEYSGLIFFRIDWFRINWFKRLSRIFSSTSLKVLILWHSDFFMVQLSHPYTTTGKTIALTILIFVGKAMSLLFKYTV